MSRKDYRLIAEVIAGVVGYDEARKIAAGAMANKLARTYGNFDRDRFLRACGVID